MTADNREDPRTVYGDIIDLPHWDSPAHPRMSLRDRAAQFAPYAALVGYGDMVKEEARETGVFNEPGEDEAEELEQALAQLERQIAAGNCPACTITCFVPDERKAGGETVTVTEKVRRIDPVNRKIILDRKKGLAGSYEEISLDRIIRIGQEDRTE
jgi:hypothetical protein